ncbi:MAG: hypothetical protein ACPLRZ_11535 [Thermovenabulum sp.]|uniref:hypothetical protein n=1 Tax=Thermovenabulum sp. TaxID=3100335 RepID=UPI003C7BE6A5
MSVIIISKILKKSIQNMQNKSQQETKHYITAKDIALAEGCSIRTAQRLLKTAFIEGYVRKVKKGIYVINKEVLAMENKINNDLCISEMVNDLKNSNNIDNDKKGDDLYNIYKQTDIHTDKQINYFKASDSKKVAEISEEKRAEHERRRKFLFALAEAIENTLKVQGTKETLYYLLYKAFSEDFKMLKYTNTAAATIAANITVKAVTSNKVYNPLAYTVGVLKNMAINKKIAEAIKANNVAVGEDSTPFRSEEETACTHDEMEKTFNNAYLAKEEAKEECKNAEENIAKNDVNNIGAVEKTAEAGENEEKECIEAVRERLVRQGFYLYAENEGVKSRLGNVIRKLIQDMKLSGERVIEIVEEMLREGEMLFVKGVSVLPEMILEYCYACFSNTLMPQAKAAAG